MTVIAICVERTQCEQELDEAIAWERSMRARDRQRAFREALRGNIPRLERLYHRLEVARDRHWRDVFGALLAELRACGGKTIGQSRSPHHCQVGYQITPQGGWMGIYHHDTGPPPEHVWPDLAARMRAAERRGSELNTRSNVAKEAFRSALERKVAKRVQPPERDDAVVRAIVNGRDYWLRWLAGLPEHFLERWGLFVVPGQSFTVDLGRGPEEVG